MRGSVNYNNNNNNNKPIVNWGNQKNHGPIASSVSPPPQIGILSPRTSLSQLHQRPIQSVPESPPPSSTSTTTTTPATTQQSQLHPQNEISISGRVADAFENYLVKLIASIGIVLVRMQLRTIGRVLVIFMFLQMVLCLISPSWNLLHTETVSTGPLTRIFDTVMNGLFESVHPAPTLHPSGPLPSGSTIAHGPTNTIKTSSSASPSFLGSFMNLLHGNEIPEPNMATMSCILHSLHPRTLLASVVAWYVLCVIWNIAKIPNPYPVFSIETIGVKLALVVIAIPVLISIACIDCIGGIDLCVSIHPLHESPIHCIDGWIGWIPIFETVGLFTIVTWIQQRNKRQV